MEKFSCYKFEIKSHDVPGWGKNVGKWVKGYFYIIYSPSGMSELDVESNEYFEHECSARLAAIGHITILENGGVYEHE